MDKNMGNHVGSGFILWCLGFRVKGQLGIGLSFGSRLGWVPYLA